MLRKIFAWEMRATWKRFSIALAIYALACVIAPNLLMMFNRDMALAWTIITFSIGYTAIYAVIFIFVLLRYNSSLYGSEGYLVLTLPVKSHTLLSAKFLAAFVWNLAAMLLIGGSTLTLARVLFANPGFHKVFEKVTFAPVGPDFWICMIALTLVGLVNQILITFFAVSFSKLPVWGKGGTGMGFVAYIVTVILEAIPSIVIGVTQSRVVTESMSKTTVIDTGKMFMLEAQWSALITYFAVGVAAFFVTSYLLRKHVSIK